MKSLGSIGGIFMTHAQDKKRDKKGSKHSNHPETISYDEMKKHTTKEVIKGTE